MTLKPTAPIDEEPSSRLAKQATTFAVILGISGGYCAIGRGPGSLIVISALAGDVSVLGLLALGITALGRFLSARFRG